MVTGVRTREQDCPETDTPGKESGPNLVSAPSRHEIHGQEDETHPIKNGGSVADESKNRCEHDVKQRHVVIEDIAILNEPARPGPDHVHVLRLIAVEAVTQHVDGLE